MKHRKYKNVFILILTVILAFVGCSEKEENSHELIVPVAEGCLVSSIRTGTARQGLSTLQNGFECTDSGAYFMCLIGTESWLLYSEHGSDRVIKLCGRPDCSHSDSDCNAYFKSGANICYYDGYLYTHASIDENLSKVGLVRMNLDGSGRVLVYNILDLVSEESFKGYSRPSICNGVYSISLKKLDDSGKEVSQTYFYKLDGSMKEPQATQKSMLIKTDGDVFVGVLGYDAESAQYIYGNWNSDDGSTTELFRTDKLLSTEYTGARAYYYIEDGIIYENSYTDGVRVLFDTGLEGDRYNLTLFPDFVVVYDYLSVEGESNGSMPKNPTLRFYDWSFNDLGSVTVDYEFDDILPSVICGETHERIMLTDSAPELIPRYYIDKSDFGTGSIKIHSYKLPDFE